jgi:hypothetical protein
MLPHLIAAVREEKPKDEKPDEENGWYHEREYGYETTSYNTVLHTAIARKGRFASFFLSCNAILIQFQSMSS